MRRAKSAGGLTRQGDGEFCVKKTCFVSKKRCLNAPFGRLLVRVRTDGENLEEHK